MKYKFCPHCSVLNRVKPEKVNAQSLTCGKCQKTITDLRSVDEVTEAQVEKLIRNADNLVVVDVFADWCGPCKSYGPIFSQVGTRNFLKAEFVKLNADRAPGFSAKFGVRGVPATLFFKQGKLVAQQAGLLNEAQLDQLASSHLVGG